jgi:hypothetical protein
MQRHLLAISVALLGTAAFAVFSWAEWGYFCDQNNNLNEILRASHAETQSCQGFWSSTHLHDWIYNAFSNYQSELLFGILIVVLLHKLAGQQDEDET